MIPPLQVLLVEDDFNVRLGCEQAMQLAGIPVTGVASAEEAERLLRPDFPGIVVTDMRLPNEYEQLTSIGAHRLRIVRNWHIPEVDTVPYHQSDIALMAHAFDTLVVNEWGKPEAMYADPDTVTAYHPISTEARMQYGKTADRMTPTRRPTPSGCA